MQNENSAIQLLQLAVASIRSGDFEKGLTALEASETYNIPFEGLHYLKAFCFLSLKRMFEVLPELRKELLLFPNSAEAGKLLLQIESEAKKNPLFNVPFLPNKKYLVSGKSPDDSGTGLFYKTLLPLAEKHGWRAVHPQIGVNFSDAERMMLNEITDSEIIVIHPQIMGIFLFLNFHENRNKITFYVLDNGFFCLRSYNFRKGKNEECLDCIGNPENCHLSCEPFPIPYNREENILYLKLLKSIAHNFRFFCQTEHQMKLVKAHFGAQTNVTVTGLKTDEFSETSGDVYYDIIFHADPHLAKGFGYAVALAKQLPEFSFLLPCPPHHYKLHFGEEPVPPNVTFEDIRWHTGLKQRIIDCKLVLCPSMWSAPVEGALMKSLYFNGNVAVFDTVYGFHREIPEELLLRLNNDMTAAAELVREHIAAEKSVKAKARAWIAQYHASVNYEQVFMQR